MEHLDLTNSDVERIDAAFGGLLNEFADLEKKEKEVPSSESPEEEQKRYPGEGETEYLDRIGNLTSGEELDIEMYEDSVLDYWRNKIPDDIKPAVKEKIIQSGNQNLINFLDKFGL